MCEQDGVFVLVVELLEATHPESHAAAGTILTNLVNVPAVSYRTKLCRKIAEFEGALIIKHLVALLRMALLQPLLQAGSPGTDETLAPLATMISLADGEDVFQS